MKYKVAVFLFVVLFQTEAATSQVYERASKESRTFEVFEETSLEVSNKYGNIHIFTWDKDSVKINVNIHVKANKESKVDKIFEYIDIEFSHTKFYIVAKTQLKQNQSSFWSEVSDLANTIFSGNNRAQIDYDVYIPNGMEIKIENKFGNIYIADYNGRTTIDLSNGDLKANELHGFVSVALGFGNASISSIDKGKLSVRYAEVELGNTDELEIESKSSTINITKAGLLQLNSQRDKLYLGEVGTVTGKSYFSYLTIKILHSKLDMKTEYGEVRFDGLSKGFNRINLQSKYTDIYLSIPSKASCSLGVSHTEATEIYFPGYFENLKTEAIDKKNDVYKTLGIIGEKSNPKANIDIRITAGMLSIKEDVQDF